MASDSDAPFAKAALGSPTPTTLALTATGFLAIPTAANASSSSIENKPAEVPTATQTAQQKHLLILAGGWDNTSSMAYDPSQDTWRQVAPLSCARDGAAAALWLGKMVVAGGYNSTDKFLNLVEEFSPITNSWTALPNLLQSRAWLACACFEQTLFAIGGTDDTENFNSVEKYTLDSQQWQRAASLNTPRGGLCCGVLEVGILVAGGTDGSTILNTCELFNGTMQKWQFAGSLVTARCGAAASVLNEMLYVFGGRDEQRELNTVEEFDCRADMWTLIPVLLSVKKWKLAAATLNGRIYVCGGDPNGNDLAESFDTSEMRIGCVAALPVAIEGAAAVSVPVTDEMYKQLFKT